MLTDSFDYNLPKSFIAKKPVSPRDSCRLMVLNRKNHQISHQHFYNLPNFLRAGDVLVFNDSKVIPARLILPYKNRNVEVFLVKRVDNFKWEVLVNPGKIFKKGFELKLENNLSLEVVEVLPDGQRLIRFSDGGIKQKEFLEHSGKAPYPPYIKDSNAKFEEYQTVYANDEGSIAAPTAGLHFTEKLLDKLRNKGILTEFATLHVGLGTFMPIKTANIHDHEMHYEQYSIDTETASRLSKAKKDGQRIIAVGTTAVRVLEDSFVDSEFKPGRRQTNLYIYPGYKWKCIDGLITNFHLPKSSLLLLVSAFAGKDFVMGSYKMAAEMKYRFYSFGDAQLIV
jgi:S-adenosylmethionine:tRNA ribosyltransferase-isomerase